MSRVMCENCRGQFVEVAYQVTDMRTLKQSHYCSPACLRQATEKELQTWAKEKE